VACITLIGAVALPGHYLLPIAVGGAAAFAAISPWREWSAVDAAAGALALAFGVSWLLSPLGVRPGPMLACLAVMWGTARIRTTRVAMALLAGVLAVGTLVLAQLAILSMHASEAERRPNAYGALSEWGGYPELGLLGSIVVPLLLGLALQARPRRVALAATLALAAASFGLMLSFARASWVSAALAAALLLVATRSRRGVFAIVLAVPLLVAAWAYIPRVSIYASMLFTSSGSVPVFERQEAWRFAWDLWGSRWLVGWGPGTYAQAFHLQFPGVITGGAQFHAHNTLLQTGVETGVLGVAAAVWLAGAVLLYAARGLRTARQTLRGVRMGLLAALLGLACRLQVDYFDPGYAPERVVIVLSIITGLAVAVSRTASADAATTEPQLAADSGSFEPGQQSTDDDAGSGVRGAEVAGGNSGLGQQS